jgi:hypothetical protein
MQFKWGVYNKETIMNHNVLECLEPRQFLSVSVSPVCPPQATAEVHVAAVTAAASTMVGNYSAAMTVDQESGQAVLRITSQSGSTFTGRLYATGWGGFDVQVTGSLGAKSKVNFSGRNETFSVKMAAKIAKDGKSFSGTCSVVQMGIASSGTCQFTRVSKVPKLPAVKVVQLAARYKGYSYGAEERTRITLSVTRQEGGHLWMTIQGSGGTSTATGIILGDGQFRLVGTSDSDRMNISGQVQRKGVLSGKWQSSIGDHGTFSVSPTK